MSYLSIDEVMRRGIEFTGDVCYSGEYGQQVYTKEAEDGGTPVEGILYERYDNGKICYYCFYHDGILDGQRVRFYETGKIKSCCVMDKGTIDGEHIEWYENGNIIKEKVELSESEKSIYEKRVKYYERESI